MFTTRYIGLMAVCLIFLSGCQADFESETVNGSVTEVQGITVLKVWGTPYEQGYAQGYLLAETIVDFYRRIYLDMGGSAFVESWQNEVLPNLGRMTIPQLYAEELRGILDGMESKLEGPVHLYGFERDLTYEDLVAVQCNEDILKMSGGSMNRCSSFCVWGSMTRDGHTVTGRNYDHRNLRCETDHRIIVVRSALASGELAWVSYCGPTEIGCTSGINEEGVTISQHDGQESYDPVNAADTIYPDGFVHRRAIETARSATARTDVADVFRGWAISSSCIPMVTWPYAQNGPASVVYEMDSDRSIDGGATLREAGGSTPYQITANYYYNRPSRSIPDYRYDLLDSQLSSIARSGGVRHVGVEEAWELLARVPADPSKTGGILVYSVVFEPNKMMMHVAVSENGEQAPLCHKISFDINALLAGVR